MTHEEIALFLEEYRDGTVNESTVERVVEKLKEGGPDARLMMEELAFNGMISQALDDMDEKNFVRCFLERISAEKGVEEFTSELEMKTGRVSVKSPPVKESTLQQLMGLLSGSPRTTANGETVARPASGIWATRLGLLALLGFLGFLVLPFLKPAPASIAELAQSSAGVTWTRDQQSLSINDQPALQNGDRITVPQEGRAMILLADKSSIVLRDQAIATVWKQGEQVEVQIEKGIIEGEINNSNVCRIKSSHALITPEKAGFSIQLSPSSTLLSVTRGTVEASRISDDGRISVTEGKRVLVSEDQEVLALESL